MPLYWVTWDEKTAMNFGNGKERGNVASSLDRIFPGLGRVSWGNLKLTEHSRTRIGETTVAKRGAVMDARASQKVSQIDAHLSGKCPKVTMSGHSAATVHRN